VKTSLPRREIFEGHQVDGRPGGAGPGVHRDGWGLTGAGLAGVQGGFGAGCRKKRRRLPMTKVAFFFSRSKQGRRKSSMDAISKNGRIENLVKGDSRLGTKEGSGASRPLAGDQKRAAEGPSHKGDGAPAGTSAARYKVLGSPGIGWGVRGGFPGRMLGKLPSGRRRSAPGPDSPQIIRTALSCSFFCQ